MSNLGDSLSAAIKAGFRGLILAFDQYHTLARVQDFERPGVFLGLITCVNSVTTFEYLNKSSLRIVRTVSGYSDALRKVLTGDQ